MLDHLSNRTRQFVQNLIDGKSVNIGGSVQGPFTEASCDILRLFAQNLEGLRSLKGGELLTEVQRLAALPVTKEVAEKASAAKIAKPIPLRLSVVRANSFRGIAPAGMDWEFDFESRSHLLYGPNGCGKSSLLGAICWCLTGRIFRDDCPPSHPAPIPVYSTDKKPKADGTRPDALALVNADGTNCAATDPYWVELQFVKAGTTESEWLRRHSHEGISRSSDGVTWTKIKSSHTAGISDLDVELRVLMPARVGHLRFGKDDGILSLFSQIVGLDDLEVIADLAGRTHSAMVREANTLKTGRLAPLEKQIERAVGEIKAASDNTVDSWATYLAILPTKRSVSDIAAFRQQLDEKTLELKTQLASDLGIELAEGDSPEAKELQQQLDNLPGHIDTATTRLETPVSQLFPTSLGLSLRLVEEVDDSSLALNTFIEAVRTKVEERLAWALKERENEKAAMMLSAASHFPEGSDLCPVCTQDLKSRPDVKAELNELHTLSNHSHLYQSLPDLQRALISDLNKIVGSNMRQQAHTELGARIQEDWTTFKAKAFLGLVKPIADKCDAAISVVAELPPTRALIASEPLAAKFTSQFPQAFSELDAEIVNAKVALALQREIALHQPALLDGITNALLNDEQSLAKLLSRGQSTNRLIKEFTLIGTLASTLDKAQREAEAIAATIKQLTDRAAAANAIKDLGVAVRQDTLNVVKSVEPVMKAFYERLYDSEHLVMDMVTTGHAANPNIKDEFNIYLRAGSRRLPVGPFANAGRLRAIGLCFVFALQQRGEGTLEFLVLDDPAISLDDEHKARFVDHLVMPRLTSDQVIMATHYENFYKCAESVFKDGTRLTLAPRRSVEDALAFEPSDLLQRVEATLKTPSTAWREMGVNLRRWVERALGTLSGYCPVPFAIFNNIQGSVDAYAAITDTRVKSNRRDDIVAALKSPQFERIMHRAAHDEDPVEAEIRDGWKVLSECRKAVEAEVTRFQGLYQHALLKRGIAGRPVIAVLGLPSQLPSVTLEVAGRAAAAANGIGITWTEDDAETLTITDHQIGLVKSDVLAPIASTGNYIVLDVEGEVPNDGDLVAVKTNDGKAYLRRLWQHEDMLNLEATNPTTPTAPVVVPTAECEARRVVGILFHGPAISPAGVEKEWVNPGALTSSQFSGTLGIRVDGTSLEPIARDGQVVLVRKIQDLEEIEHGQLACIDIEDRGAVLKRCYRDNEEWILCPVNPVDVEIPIRVSTNEILHAYRIVGVLFEPILEKQPQA